MSGPTFVDPQLEAELTTRGYVRLRLMTADDAEALRRSMLAMLPVPVRPTIGPIYISTMDEDHGIRAALQERLIAVFASLLETHIVGGRQCESSVIIKPAGGARLGLHHHASFTENPFERAMVCWLALTDADQQTSALRLIPNSHQILPHIALPKSPSYFEPFRDELEANAFSADVTAGEAIIFEQTLLHGSSPNMGATDRVALTCLLTSGNSRNVLFVPRGEEHLEIFDTQDSRDLAHYYETGMVLETWRSIGVIPNRNTKISADDFAALIAQPVKADGTNDPLGLVRAAVPWNRQPAAKKRTIADRLRSLLT